MEKKIDKKVLIMQFLNNKGRASTSRIASEIKSDLNMANRYLKDLEEQGKIKREEESLGTFWIL